MDRDTIQTLLERWCRKLRITPAWDVQLQLIDDEAWTKTGDIKIDCDNRKAILMLNAMQPKWENIEEVIVHELFHLKLYPLDQTTESLITSCFDPGSRAYEFAMTQFMRTLEQTVEELAKCFLLEFGENRQLSFRRLNTMRSFDDLFQGLNNLE